ncbi:MAG: glycosyltransferase family 39 protein, partial [Thaumarchaeota archaeon]|nr:glycosyltransferase family 39 protein [Nitrososphaerota archaeon]
MATSLISSHDSDLYHYSRQWGAHLGQFPVAWQHYNGNVLATYLTVPFLYFIGINVAAVRIYELAVAIAVLVLTYYCGKEIFSKNTGMIGASLLSILPSFVFYSRQSSLYDWTDLCVALLVVIFGVRYLKYKKTLYLFASLFLVGIGVYEYLWFVWIVIGLLATIPLWIKKIKFDKK